MSVDDSVEFITPQPVSKEAINREIFEASQKRRVATNELFLKIDD